MGLMNLRRGIAQYSTRTYTVRMSDCHTSDAESAYIRVGTASHAEITIIKIRLGLLISILSMLCEPPNNYYYGCGQL